MRSDNNNSSSSGVKDIEAYIVNDDDERLRAQVPQAYVPTIVPIPHQINGYPQHINGASSYPHIAGSNTSSGTVIGRQQHVYDHPPVVGRWRDGICDCCSNLWPSCGCSFFICHGAWLLGM